MESCVFCNNLSIVLFHEHYIFCTNCSAIYTNMILQNSSCEHINNNSVVVERLPWYKQVIDNVAYIKDGKCSICGKDAVSDGW